MGQDRTRIHAQAASIRAKNERTFWVSELQRRLDLDAELSQDVASDICDYLAHRGILDDLGTISLPLIEGRDYNAKRGASSLPRKQVAVQLVADEDVQILEEFGNSAMLTARMARIIEDAYWADGIFNGPLLALLFPLSLRTLRSRLRKLWARGATLPLSGTSHRYRAQWKDLRPVLAVRRYLQGERPLEVRKSLLVSPAAWSQWWDQFNIVYHERNKIKDPGRLAEKLGCPAPLATEWLRLTDEVDEEAKRFSLPRLMQLRESEFAAVEKRLSTPLTVRYLHHRHDLPPSTAEKIVQLVREFAAGLEEKGDGQVVHFAACSQVTSSQSLLQSELCAVYLNYITNGDWDRVDLQRPTELRCHRLRRLISEAYLQNAALSLPDAAFLVGMSTDAVSNVLRNDEETALLTRGRVTILEPVLDRAEEVIRLFCGGRLSVRQVQEETGYRRSHIEQYLRRFCQVVSLKRQGHGPTEVARRLGISPRAARYCADLCDRLQQEMDDPRSTDEAFERLQSRFAPKRELSGCRDTEC